MSEMAKIVQQRRLENKKLEKLFSDSQTQALPSCLKLSVGNKRILLQTRGTIFSHQRSLGLITR
jgi:hypothetical protein